MEEKGDSGRFWERVGVVNVVRVGKGGQENEGGSMGVGGCLGVSK